MYMRNYLVNSILNKGIFVLKVGKSRLMMIIIKYIVYLKLLVINII